MTQQQRNRNLVAKVMRRYGISDPAKHIAIAYPRGVTLKALRIYQLIDRSIQRHG